ncbi:NUDIX domain-containing protein [Nibricoccus sp. IMCC34717]|uniref:NUDIX hydrolase n=1 Tax=Nibricoccus sp. IMCC34717 TaxID=3034021 RepID=UPI00384A9B45
METPATPPLGQNPNELFDVVNERDEVIGQAPRSEVHARGLLHRAVHVWVRNARGEVFLQKRSRWKDMSPLRWDSSCSGHLDAGEGYATAAVRELVEEIGLRVDGPAALQQVLRVTARPETGGEFVNVYTATSEGPFTLNPAEIEEGRWWTPEELQSALQQTPENFTRPFRYLWTSAPLIP